MLPPTLKHISPKPLAISRRSLLCAAPAVLAGCVTPPPSPNTELNFDPTTFPKAPVSPPLPQGPLTTLALSSCSDETRAAPLYSEITALKPDALLMLGDNVYGSSTPEDPMLSDLRAAYWQMARRSEFRDLVSQVPTLSVWDDHDFGKNDAGGDFAHKALAQKMFTTFWNIPLDSPLQSRAGIYRAVTIGPPNQQVQIIILDTRYFRDPLRPTDQRDAPGRERYMPHPESANLDILGTAQWAWLEEELQRPAQIRIIASSIQVVADGHGWERWGQFPAARRRLCDLIARTNTKGVVFVSGDRHLGAINCVEGVTPFPLYDLTASAINTSSWRDGGPTDNGEAGPFRIGPSYTPPNFGLVRFDWAARTLKLEIIGLNRLVANEVSVDFAKLGVV